MCFTFLTCLVYYAVFGSTSFSSLAYNPTSLHLDIAISTHQLHCLNFPTLYPLSKAWITDESNHLPSLYHFGCWHRIICTVVHKYSSFLMISIMLLIFATLSAGLLWFWFFLAATPELGSSQTSNPSILASILTEKAEAVLYEVLTSYYH